MMKMIFKIFASLFALGTSSLYAQSTPLGWIETQPFQDEKQQDCRRNSDLSWVAETKGQDLIIRSAAQSSVEIPTVLATHIEKLKLTLPERNPSPVNSQSARALLELPTGWLVGFDLGEWGGSLWWFDLNGEATKLSDNNTHQFIQFENSIYAAQGLAHLSLDRGSLIIFTLDSSDVPQITNTIETPSSLEAISLWNTKIVGASFLGPVIITRNGVVRYDGSDQVRRRHINYPR